MLTSTACSTRMSAGRKRLMAFGKFAAGIVLSVSKQATFPSAWTPLSVRLAPTTGMIFPSFGRSCPSARWSSPWIVGTEPSGWAAVGCWICQPR